MFQALRVRERFDRDFTPCRRDASPIDAAVQQRHQCCAKIVSIDGANFILECNVRAYMCTR
jgi:hypothetical protein